MVNLLELFSTDRRLLETRGSLIIRQLCLNLNTERIYRTFAEILEKEEVCCATLSLQGSSLIALIGPRICQCYCAETEHDSDYINGAGRFPKTAENSGNKGKFRKPLQRRAQSNDYLRSKTDKHYSPLYTAVGATMLSRSSHCASLRKHMNMRQIYCTSCERRALLL